MHTTLVNPDGLSIPCSISWSEAAPLEITMMFHLGTDHVIWTFGRDLLRYPMDHIPEDFPGDVAVFASDRGMFLCFHSPYDEAVLRVANVHSVSGFLEATYSVVPEGSEDMSQAVDDAIFAILERGY